MRFAEIGGVGVWRACAVGALLAAGTAEAETRTWTGDASGAWEVAANWSPAGVPAAGDTAAFADSATIAEGWTLPGDLKITVVKGKTLDFNGPIAGAADAKLTISAGAADGAATVNFNASSTFQGNLDIQRGLVYGKADDAFGVASDDTPRVQLVANDKFTKLYLTGIRNMKRIDHRPHDPSVGHVPTLILSGNNVLGRYETHSTVRTKVASGSSVRITRGVSNSGIWLPSVAADANITLADVPSSIQYYGEGGPGPLIFACAGNSFSNAGSEIPMPYVCLVNDAFVPSSDLAFGSKWDTDPALDLNGTTQTVARLRSKTDYAYPGVVRSAQPGLVVVTDAFSFTNNMAFAGQASLEVRIAEEATATLGGKSTTSGDLIAASGTVELGEQARWEGRVRARQGGVVRIRSAASLAYTARLALEGGTLELVDGVACVKELVKADGTACAPGSYAATAREGATVLPGLAGEGVITVLSDALVVPDGATWTWTGKAGDGKVSTPGNWCDADGVAATAEHGPDLSDAGNLLHFPAAAAVVVDAPLAAKRLFFDGEGEGTVTFTAPGADGFVALYGGSFVVTNADASAASAKKTVEIEAPFRYAGDVEMSVLKNCGVVFRGRLATVGSANLVKRGFGTLWIQGDANRLYGDIVNSNGVLYLAGKDPLGGDGVLRNYQFDAKTDTYCCLSNAVVTRAVENWPEGNVGNGAQVLYTAPGTTNVLQKKVSNKKGHFRFGAMLNGELTFAGGLEPNNFVMPQGRDSSSVMRVRDVPINTSSMLYQDCDNMSIFALAVPSNAFNGEMFVCATVRTEVDDAVLERHRLRFGKGHGRLDLWGTTQHVANATVEAMTTNAAGLVTAITGEVVAYDDTLVKGLCGGNIKSDRPGAYIAFTGNNTFPLSPVFGGDVTFERAGTGTNVFYQANTSTGAVIVTGGCVRFAAPGATWMHKDVAQTYRSTGGSWAGRRATVTGGTLAFDHAAAFPEDGDFRLGGDGVLVLAEGVSLRANSLAFLEDGAWVDARSGVWGAPGNAAASRHTARIAGAGVLRVGKMGTFLILR